jgi:drug/metabolite transporter (DMT)-like permease
MVSQTRWTYLGPIFVIIGAALWGTETFFRNNLNAHFDSEVLVFYEHLFCILFTLPFAYTPLKLLIKIPRSAWLYLILSGVIGSALGTTFFTLSLTKLNLSVANVLLNFQPIVSVGFAYLLLHEKPGRHFFYWSGLAIICGAVISWGEVKIGDFLIFNVGIIYIFITNIAWGFSTVAGRGAMIHMPLRLATFGRFLIGALTLLVSLSLKGLFTKSDMHWFKIKETYVVTNFLWLSVFSGVIPLYFYFKGLSKTSASVGGFCELTQTFSALILTWGILHNALSPSQVIAGILLIFCVYNINLNYTKRAVSAGEFSELE